MFIAAFDACKHIVAIDFCVIVDIECAELAQVFYICWFYFDKSVVVDFNIVYLLIVFSSDSRSIKKEKNKGSGILVILLYETYGR